MHAPNGMFLNGPKVGQVITLPEPPPEVVEVVVMINVCHHRTELDTPLITVRYDVGKGVDGGPLYMLTTKDKQIANGYFCMMCKEEAEAKFKLRELRDKINELLGEEEY